MPSRPRNIPSSNRIQLFQFMSRYDAEDPEEWLTWFNEKKTHIQDLRELIISRDQAIKTGSDVAKLNADIRRKFQREEKDLKTLKAAIKKVDGLSQKEATGRRTQIDQLIDEREELMKKFNSVARKQYNSTSNSIEMIFSTLMIIAKSKRKMKLEICLMKTCSNIKSV